MDLSSLHHITAIASDAQRNVDFYCGTLGLRLVKKTVNFDAPDVYHLYYGNETGDPGTLLTFFIFSAVQRGRQGKGQITEIAFSIAEEAIAEWAERLKTSPHLRFGEKVLRFEDPDGMQLAIIGSKNDNRPGKGIKGLYGITLSEECLEKTSSLLTQTMNYKKLGEEEGRHRFGIAGKPGEIVDIFCRPDGLPGFGGVGTVHHAAFSTPTEETQTKARLELIASGFNVTAILDRQYFHSIYFREPGGVLFEVASALPGFAIDEPIDHLGETLKLPPWLEKNREWIEHLLPPIRL